MYYPSLKFINNQSYAILYQNYSLIGKYNIDDNNELFYKFSDIKSKFTSLDDNDKFIIVDDGLNSVINLLILLKLWNTTVKTKASLFYISFNKFHVHPNDIELILNKFPEIIDHDFIKQYYLLFKTKNRIFLKNNIYLDFIAEDIAESINKFDFKADYWIFNNISYNAINYDRLFLNAIDKSNINSCFLVIDVDNQIQNYIIKKLQHFQILKSIINRQILFKMLVKKLADNTNYSWYKRPKQFENDKTIAIIGAGISGACCAYSLAKRGYKVKVYEGNSRLGDNASGIYQTILYGNFFTDNDLELQLSTAGYKFSHNLITSLLKEDFDQCGIIQKINLKKGIDYYKERISDYPDNFAKLINNNQICQLSKVNIDLLEAVFFPYGLWVNLTKLINKLFNHSNIEVIINCEISSIEKVNNLWKVANNQYADYFSSVVFCCSYNLNNFNILKNYNYYITRGQITKINQKIDLKTIVCLNSSITPNYQNYYTVGSTINRNIFNPENSIEDNKQNLLPFKNLLFDNDISIDSNKISSEVQFRAHSVDYFPIVGPVCEYYKFIDTYKDLNDNFKININKECPYLPGIFVSSLFGTKGVLFAPICGEIIADYIDQSPFCASEKIINKIHPNRLYINKLKNKNGNNI